MNHRPLLWHLFPALLLVSTIAIIAIVWFLGDHTRSFYYQQSIEGMRAQALLLESRLAEHKGLNHQEIREIVRESGERIGTRFTIILADGKVTADSLEDPSVMENHRDRPEFTEALAGRQGVSQRFSTTLARSFLYVAIPVRLNGEVVGAVRASLPLTRIQQTMIDIYSYSIKIGLGTAFAIALISLLLSRRIARPLEELRVGVDHFAQGDFSWPLPETGYTEVTTLTRGMYQMSAQIEERIATIEEQAAEREAILASMIEGVLAVDRTERVIRINGAAAALLGTTIEQAGGRFVQEICRHPELHRQVSRALASKDAIEETIELIHHGTKRHLQVHASTLTRGERRVGALLVLHDITRLRRLEQIRQDFVSNVSHELKTPITAIRGATEVLQEALEGSNLPEERFLHTISRQTERLHAIIEDLLTLSRIEQGVDKVDLRQQPLAPILLAAVETCRFIAEKKEISITTEITEPCVAAVTAPLLEQALINLLGNAVTYSPSGSLIEASLTRSEDMVIFAVRDQGPGIPAEHQSRLFERFYRVDPARSRSQGGTGLGLAIVKHIAHLHAGKVSVESAIGRGSTFRIHIPLPARS